MGPRRRGCRPWSLRTRLVVSAVALIAVVGAAIGTVTTLALRSYLVGQLDEQLTTSVGMAVRMPSGKPARQSSTGFVTAPGSPLDATGVRLDPDGTVLGTARNVRVEGAPEDAPPLTEPQSRLLAAAARKAAQAARSAQAASSGQGAQGAQGTQGAQGAQDGQGRQGARAESRPVDADLPGLGAYRVLAAPDGSLALAFPLSEVDSIVRTLVGVEVCVTLAGLIAASLAGQALVGVALRPLRRVAATATRVSELPLHKGEPALHERVPDAEADPRTEVGQVGAALNRMLGHVSSALTARQQSEMRVRQFVADASHELRTPLASIRGYAELTRRGREEPGPDTRHALGRIESEATRMTGLVEDLLLLARLDAGRPLSSADADTDLAPLVVDAVSDARAAGPGHHWRLSLPAEPAPVRADPARIQQVLVNLLANARTHTPPGTTVTACVSRETSAVRLMVEDDGPGIPPELLPHAFERFARGDASRSRTAGSTGLGLAIVQAVVTAHGGRVGVRSEPGRTRFEVVLPLARPTATEPESQTGHRLTTQR
ncbi:HAMP domain-containing sensor histidine kinase [Streptomyces sp. MB09-01]|uniref:sensor histidine kinase n=1 Tax=Streptomyces sp. MB09-01 TaxID=3028666 RepID=UPI0029A30C87|nr:HAMP domain-containing sensor histidine kinase [Streptomyces sp. MB09-01]MDX3535344.1 HAMP domain-containing sensor histidine kinase [Streptomyces sp. MB09-01]